MTEEKLKKLFDFQRFEQNPRLQKVISDTHRRIESRELTDDELDLVAAAGVPDEQSLKKPGDKRNDS